MIFSIIRKAFFGKATFIAGKWIMNCMPLIIPQTYAKQPDITVWRIALPTTAAVVAAVDALLRAITELVANPFNTCLEHG
jgi:hypothetical protein